MESLAIDQVTNMLASFMPPLLRQYQAIQQLPMDTLALMLLTIFTPVLVSIFVGKTTNVPLSCCLAQNLLAAEIAHYLMHEALGLGECYDLNETFHAARYTRNIACATLILWDLLVSKGRIAGPWQTQFTPIWKFWHVYHRTFETSVRDLHAKYGKQCGSVAQESVELTCIRRPSPNRTL